MTKEERNKKKSGMKMVKKPSRKIEEIEDEKVSYKKHELKKVENPSQKKKINK